jgi:hypothetical protein
MDFSTVIETDSPVVATGAILVANTDGNKSHSPFQLGQFLSNLRIEPPYERTRVTYLLSAGCGFYFGCSLTSTEQHEYRLERLSLGMVGQPDYFHENESSALPRFTIHITHKRSNHVCLSLIHSYADVVLSVLSDHKLRYLGFAAPIEMLHITPILERMLRGESTSALYERLACMVGEVNVQLPDSPDYGELFPFWVFEGSNSADPNIALIPPVNTTS